MSRSEEEPEDQVQGALSATRLSVGFLALLPLLVAYELSLPRPDGRRSLAELVVSRLPEELSLPGLWVRSALLGVGTLVALFFVARAGRGLVPVVSRPILEGIAAGLVLGPVLVGLLHLASGHVALPALPAPSADAPGLDRLAFVAGSTAWEECVFRLVGYGLTAVVLRHLAAFFGAPGHMASMLAELTALLLSAAAFAAVHLTRFSAWLGTGGEAFDGPAFAWRMATGVLLALLFRWRGLAVAAWAHAVFHVALALGAGPDVFVGGR